MGEQAKCSCDHKLPSAIDRGRVDTHRLRWAPAHQESYAAVRDRVRETTDELRSLTLQRAVPRFGSPADFGRMIEELVASATGVRLEP